MHWPWRVCEIIFILIAIVKLVSPWVCEISLLYYYKLQGENWRIMHCSCNWRLPIFDTWFKLKFLLLRFEASRGVRGRGDKKKSLKDRVILRTNLILILCLESPCLWALVWPSIPHFIPKLSVDAKWPKLGSVSWNWLSTENLQDLVLTRLGIMKG
jgi:hypothetical protein